MRSPVGGLHCSGGTVFQAKSPFPQKQGQQQQQQYVSYASAGLGEHVVAAARYQTAAAATVVGVSIGDAFDSQDGDPEALPRFTL